MSRVYALHGITTKFVPFGFMLIAFLYVSDYTRQSFLGFIDPTTLFVVTIISIAGAIWAYEGFYLHIVNKTRKVGTFGGYFFYFLSGLNFVFATVIFLKWYNPFIDSGDLNFGLQVLMVFDIVMFISAGIYEILAERKLVPKNPINYF